MNDAQSMGCMIMLVVFVIVPLLILVALVASAGS